MNNYKSTEIKIKMTAKIKMECSFTNLMLDKINKLFFGLAVIC